MAQAPRPKTKVLGLNPSSFQVSQDIALTVHKGTKLPIELTILPLKQPPEIEFSIQAGTLVCLTLHGT